MVLLYKIDYKHNNKLECCGILLNHLNCFNRNKQTHINIECGAINQKFHFLENDKNLSQTTLHQMHPFFCATHTGSQVTNI